MEETAKKTIRKSNWLYIFYYSFTSDLLFWIVINNLFLTTVKGFSAFDIVLISMVGLGGSLLFYPLTNLIVKKTSNKTSIIIGSTCYCVAIILFMVSGSIYGFMIGEIIYHLSSPFRMVANVMLKNNLKEQGKQDDFVKWQSWGKLGYAIITLAISLFAGVLFNVWAYLPMILSLGCAAVGLILSCIYSDNSQKQEEQKSNVKISTLMKNKVMILVMLMNFLAVGTYVFLQGKATLLIQYVCQDVGFDVAKISLIVSALVFGSRIMRVLSNLLFPKIYNKVQSKQKIVLTLGGLILLSNICFAIGGNINANYILKLAIITIGFYIILSVRDMYAVTENRIITTKLDDNQQKQAFVLANIYGKIGRLLSNVFGLVILGCMSLNMLYVCMLVFSVAQIFVCIPLSKYLKSENLNGN